MTLKTVPFDIYIPESEYRPTQKVATIEIEVEVDGAGEERITPESSDLIDRVQARYMGLMVGADIVALRRKLGVTQSRLAELLGCGEKSLSRWENGREFPSQLVNTLLRLLEDGRVDIADLLSTRQPRPRCSSRPIYNAQQSRKGLRNRRKTNPSKAGKK